MTAHTNCRTLQVIARQSILGCLLCLSLLPTKSEAQHLCVQGGLNSAYQTLPQDALACLALDLSDETQPPVSTKLDSKPLLDALYDYANLVRACTAGLGYDGESLFDDYINTAYAHANEQCQEMINTELDRDTFDQLVYQGDDYGELVLHLEPREYRYQHSSLSPLTLGWGTASDELIRLCHSDGRQLMFNNIPAEITNCFEGTAPEESVGVAEATACLSKAGITEAEFPTIMQSALETSVGRSCLMMSNYLLTNRDLENFKLYGTEKLAGLGASYELSILAQKAEMLRQNRTGLFRRAKKGETTESLAKWISQSSEHTFTAKEIKQFIDDQSDDYTSTSDLLKKHQSDLLELSTADDTTDEIRRWFRKTTGVTVSLSRVDDFLAHGD